MIIIDASIAFSLIDQGDPNHQAAINLRGEIAVPALLYIEIANALACKTTYSEEEIQEALELLYKLPFRVLSTPKTLMLESMKEAKRYHTSVYDMLYAMLAKAHGATLITADRKFIEKTHFPFVKSAN